MIAGSLDNGTVDVEHSPHIARVAPPLGDVVHRLERTAAVQAEQLHLQHVALMALTARVYALEESVKALEAAAK